MKMEHEVDAAEFFDVSYSTTEENVHQWQDNTLLNEAFSQLDKSNQGNCAMNSLDQEVSVSNNLNRESILYPEDDAAKGDDRFLLDIDPNSYIEMNMSQNINVLKRRETLNNTVENKRNRIKSCEIVPGLSDEIMSLTLKKKGIEKLYEWQQECLNLEAVKNRKNLIYALPTSGGKTLVAELLILKEVICNRKNAIFILPFVAIVQEKVQSMAPLALELGFLIEEYAATRGTFPPKHRRKKNSVYICTIEKSLSLINSLIEEKRLWEIGIIVVDELHLLGENGGRGATLESLLTKVLYVNENIHIVGMSATIGNLNEIAKFLNAELYTGNFRPVEIKEYVKCEDSIWLFDPKSEDLLTDLKKISYRYSQDAALIDPDRIGGLVMDVIPNDSCLIFCSSRKNCENVALLLSQVLFKSLENCKKIEKQRLLHALENEEGLCPILNRTIKFGVAYHHSGLTSEERKLLEDAFRAGTLCVICCTSTLAAGVNLPARRVILRSPYVGNQFLNISRYKQMIGRAGRAGLGTIGEGILICKSSQLPKVKELLTSKMDDSLSTLHVEKDRGINNLILSSILLRIARTRNDLHSVVSKSLLNIQKDRLNITTKKVVDEALTNFLKSGVMKVKEQNDCSSSKLNVTVAIPTQCEESKDTVEEKKKKKKTILLTGESELELCDLGRAAMKGCIDMQSAYTLYKDLKSAQKHLILTDYLHLLYLVTPYDIISQVKPVGHIYYDVVTSLSDSQMYIARLLGITEVTITKIRDGLMPKGIEPRVIQRFYVTLILYDLWNQHAVYLISEKYQVSRGIVQNLLNSVSSFASSVVRFCDELDEFWAFKDLFSTFSKKLSYCCPVELESLMELPLVRIGRARQLYNAGYRTIQLVAKANESELVEKIPYLNRKTVTRIIEAAKLLIVEKFENLQDEVEDVLDGIDINHFGTIRN